MRSTELIGSRVGTLGRVEVEVLLWRAPGGREESETRELGPAIAAVPSVWVRCPCEGTGRMGGRACLMCGGSGKLSADVAMDPDDSEGMEAGSTAAG